VRGRERSRTPEAVIEECVRLQDQGAQEIMLLGKNVNSYRGGGAEFAELLYRIDRLGIPRIRFMTSHPKDLSDELIQAFGELKHLMPQLHLPVQAGSDEVLRRMNRRYTRAHYLELVRKLRDVCPDIGLTSDLIVGFPGETLEQFEETLSLVRNVRFDAAYTFIYSPRRGTRAATYPDDTPYEVKSERIQRLIDLQQAIALEVLESQVGRRERVLVEAISTRDSGAVGGKTPRGHMVNFAGDSTLIGQFVDVEITSAGRNTLRGRMIDPEV
jgi:tRNA-2-methylthio-N6-dimethylallyladenosine synthase